jgi:hypothetical protein
MDSIGNKPPIVVNSLILRRGSIVNKNIKNNPMIDFKGFECSYIDTNQKIDLNINLLRLWNLK